MQTKNKSARFALLVRKMMIPPVMAVAFFVVLYLFRKGIFSCPLDFAAAVFGIGLFPVLAYPAAFLIPALKKKGREGQRNLAFAFSAAGYLLSFLYSLLPGRSQEYRLITLIYLFSVIMLLIFNKLLGIRASGHSCSVSGPMLASLMLLGMKSLLPCLLLWGLSLWASIKAGRHTMREFLMGALANLLASMGAVLAVGL